MLFYLFCLFFNKLSYLFGFSLKKGIFFSRLKRFRSKVQIKRRKILRKNYAGNNPPIIQILLFRALQLMIEQHYIFIACICAKATGNRSQPYKAQLFVQSDCVDIAFNNGIELENTKAQLPALL